MQQPYNKPYIDRHATLAMTDRLSCLGGEEGGFAAFLSTYAFRNDLSFQM